MKVQKKGVFWNLAGFLLLVAAMGLVLGSCELKVDNKVAEPKLTVFGKVVDQRTLKGIPGATVTIKVNGELISTVTETSSQTLINGEQVDDSEGDFVIGDLPLSVSGSPLIIQGPPVAEGAEGKVYMTLYSQVNADLNSGTGGIGGDSSVNLGNFSLAEGVAVTVYVVDDKTGQFVSNKDKSPLAIIPDYAFSGTTGGGLEKVFATQDEKDANKYTVAVPKTGNSSIYVQDIDTDADGYQDYGNATEQVTAYEKSHGALTVILNVTEMTGSFAIGAPIKDSFNSDNDDSMKFQDGGSAVWFYFNQPVEKPSDAEGDIAKFSVTFTDNLQNLTTSPAVTEYLDGDGITVKTDLGGNRLKITPDDDWVVNETYSYDGFVRGFPLDDNTNNTRQEESVSGSFRVTYDEADGIGGSGTDHVVADNFNSCAGEAAIGTGGSGAACSAGGDAGNVRLVFPEPVWGDMLLLSSVQAGTDVPAGPDDLGTSCTGINWYPALGTADTATDSIAQKGSNYGAAGCVIDLSGFGLAAMVDSVTNSVNSVTVYLDVYDSDGHALTSEDTYPVQ